MLEWDRKEQLQKHGINQTRKKRSIKDERRRGRGLEEWEGQDQENGRRKPQIAT